MGQPLLTLVLSPFSPFGGLGGKGLGYGQPKSVSPLVSAYPSFLFHLPSFGGLRGLRGLGQGLATPSLLSPFEGRERLQAKGSKKDMITQKQKTQPKFQKISLFGPYPEGAARDSLREGRRLKEIKVGDICELKISALGPNNIGIDEFTFPYPVFISNVSNFYEAKIKAKMLKIVVSNSFQKNLKRGKELLPFGLQPFFTKQGEEGASARQRQNKQVNSYAVAKFIEFIEEEGQNNPFENVPVFAPSQALRHPSSPPPSGGVTGEGLGERAAGQGVKSGDILTVSIKKKGSLGLVELKNNFRLIVPLSVPLVSYENVKVKVTRLKKEYGFATLLFNESAKLEKSPPSLLSPLPLAKHPVTPFPNPCPLWGLRAASSLPKGVTRIRSEEGGLRELRSGVSGLPLLVHSAKAPKMSVGTKFTTTLPLNGKIFGHFTKYLLFKTSFSFTLPVPLQGKTPEGGKGPRLGKKTFTPSGLEAALSPPSSPPLWGGDGKGGLGQGVDRYGENILLFVKLEKGISLGDKVRIKIKSICFANLGPLPPKGVEAGKVSNFIAIGKILQLPPTQLPNVNFSISSPLPIFDPLISACPSPLPPKPVTPFGSEEEELRASARTVKGSTFLSKSQKALLLMKSIREMVNHGMHFGEKASKCHARMKNFVWLKVPTKPPFFTPKPSPPLWGGEEGGLRGDGQRLRFFESQPIEAQSFLSNPNPASVGIRGKVASNPEGVKVDQRVLKRFSKSQKLISPKINLPLWPLPLASEGGLGDALSRPLNPSGLAFGGSDSDSIAAPSSLSPPKGGKGWERAADQRGDRSGYPFGALLTPEGGRTARESHYVTPDPNPFGVRKGSEEGVQAKADYFPKRPLIKKGHHIINLLKTRRCLNKALKKLSKYALKGRTFLFIGTKKSASALVARASFFIKNSFYVNTRWLGGMLTNWKTICKSISKIRPILKEKQKIIREILQRRQIIKSRLIKKALLLRKKSKLILTKGRFLVQTLKKINENSGSTRALALAGHPLARPLPFPRRGTGGEEGGLGGEEGGLRARVSASKGYTILRAEFLSRGKVLLEKRHQLLQKSRKFILQSLLFRERGLKICLKQKALLNQLAIYFKKLSEYKYLLILTSEIRNLGIYAFNTAGNLSNPLPVTPTPLSPPSEGLGARSEEGGQRSGVKTSPVSSSSLVSVSYNKLKELSFVTLSPPAMQSWIIPNPPKEILNKIILSMKNQSTLLSVFPNPLPVFTPSGLLDPNPEGAASRRAPSGYSAGKGSDRSEGGLRFCRRAALPEPLRGKQRGCFADQRLKGEVKGEVSENSIIVCSTLLCKFARFSSYIQSVMKNLMTHIEILERESQSCSRELNEIQNTLKMYLTFKNKYIFELQQFKTNIMNERSTIRIIKRQLKGLEAQKKLIKFLPHLKFLPTPQSKISEIVQILLSKFVDPKFKYPIENIYDQKLNNISSPKKLAAARKKKLQRLEKYFGGIANMTKLTKSQISKNIAIIIGQKEEMNAVRECQKLGIKMFTIVDTNCNPTLSDYIVPANDDSRSSIKYILTQFITRIRLAQKIRSRLRVPLRGKASLSQPLRGRERRGARA